MRIMQHPPMRGNVELIKKAGDAEPIAATASPARIIISETSRCEADSSLCWRLAFTLTAATALKA